MKKRRFVWSWPLLLIICITICTSLLQSCGAIKVSHLNKRPILTSLNQLNAMCWVSGFTIVIGIVFAYYVHRELKKLEDRINQLKHSE